MSNRTIVIIGLTADIIGSILLGVGVLLDIRRAIAYIEKIIVFLENRSDHFAKVIAYFLVSLLYILIMMVLYKYGLLFKILLFLFLFLFPGFLLLIFTGELATEPEGKNHFLNFINSFYSYFLLIFILTPLFLLGASLGMGIYRALYVFLVQIKKTLIIIKDKNIERLLGWTGLILLILGYVSQAYINWTTIKN